ncbi:MAG: hypothetical protein RMK92_00550 [Armatimonadota bacterium]|nr:hypothetical protein [Armatimonadota bacterium]
MLLLLVLVMQAQAQKQVLRTWNAVEGTFAWDEQVRRSGERSVRLHNPTAELRSGVVHVVELNQKRAIPFRVSAWSRAQEVSGTPDAGYSLYLDLLYIDGTPEWGLISPFSTGTHDWERREVLVIPRKPVAKVNVYLLLRNHAGTVWFDDVQLEVLKGMQALDMQPTQQPTLRAGKSAVSWGTQSGLQVHFDHSGLVAGVSLGGKQLPAGKVAGGWFLRDMRQPERLVPFRGAWQSRKPLLWTGKAGDLTLEVRYEQVGALLQATATLRAPQGSPDRAVSLVWAVPLQMKGATWHNDIRERVAAEQGENARYIRIQAGANSMMSLYPLACLTGKDWGLAWGWRMDEPRLVRLFANSEWGWACAAYDLVLTGKTRKFPHRATVHVLLWSVEPKWGFRSALMRYIQTFPDWFRNRVPKQGIWIAFTAPHTIQGVQDFGIVFHEGDNSVAEDDQLGILSFRYTEPMSYWMPMPKEFARTDAGVEECLRYYAEGKGGDWQKAQALATLKCGLQDSSGKFYRHISVTPWNDGAMFFLNPDPDLPASADNPSKAYLNFPPDHAQRAYTGASTQGLDGEYLDSLEMGADVLNFREEHFATVDVPLVFETGSLRPAIMLIFSTWEYTRYLAGEMRRRGKWLFANAVGWRFPFLMAFLDISGTETNWWQDGTWQPISPAYMDVWRSMSYQKPYVLLMNTDYETFGGQVERYFQRCLFWGIFPSMFSHNASDNPYWQNPNWYNRDRALFQKYIPLLRRVAEAGWEPLTHATAEGAWVERYGKRLLTLFNPESAEREVRVQVDLRALGIPDSAVRSVEELAHGLRVEWKVERGALHLRLRLAPEQTAVVTW